MAQADRIREFVLQNFIEPERAKNKQEVVVRAGDVHSRMGLINAGPAVCSVLGGRKFEALANVELRERNGPHNGSNVFFRFGLATVPRPPATPTSVREAGEPLKRITDINFENAVVLISCVKSKLARAAPARDLYVSSWFIKARREQAPGIWTVA